MKLRDCQKQLQDTQKALQDTQRASQDTQRALRDTQKALRDSWTAQQDTQYQFQGSQEELEDTRQELQGTQTELKAKKEQLEEYESDIEGLKLRLFRSYREGEEYDEAQNIYEEILNNYTEADPPAAVLEMKYSYAEQLCELGDFPKAKKIAEDVWERRRKLDSLSESPRTMSEESKKSHRQVCSIYNSLGEFDAAETEQGSLYQGLPKDAWKLENGDALCITLMKNRKCEEAALLQLRVWEERRQLESPGRWDECTIRSALNRVSFLEDIVKDLSDELSTHKGPEWEKESIRCRKKCRENDIIEMLRHVWTMPKAPELRLQILQVGRELGRRLVAGKHYADAEMVLKDVWEAGTALYPEANQLTMSAGRILVDVLKLQESPQRYKSAASWYRRILEEAKPMFGENDDWVISVGIALGETLFLDGQNANPDGAEQICRWVLEQKTKKLGQADPQVLDARYKLGKALHAQGRERDPELAQILQDVYDGWNTISPESSATVECGRLLVKTYEEDEDLAPLEPIRTFFNGRNGVSEKDMLYLESGYLLGKLLLREKNSEGARELLGPLWNYQAGTPEEQRVRLRCGQLYGQSLLDCGQYEPAEMVLDSIKRDQLEMFGETSPEGDQITELLKQVRKNRAKQKPQKRAPNSYRSRR